jgi:excisionase family DNA binding protein
MMNNGTNGKIKKVLYRIDEVAEILNVSRRTVYRLLEEGVLIGHKRNPMKAGMRITVDSVERFLKKYELPPDYFLDKSLPVHQMGEET